MFFTFTDDLDFQGHSPVKSIFGPYLGSCSTNCHQILTQGSLDQGLQMIHEMYAKVLCWPPFERNNKYTQQTMLIAKYEYLLISMKIP